MSESKPPMLIDYYRAIEDSSRKMLEAAQARDWDEVLRCESACAVLIEQLRMHARSTALEPAQRSEKNRIMLRILENDARIRELAEPWLPEFDSWLHPAPVTLH